MQPVDDIPDNITASGLLDMIIDGRRLGDLTPREAMAWVARVNAEIAERKRRAALISAAYGLDPERVGRSHILTSAAGRRMAMKGRQPPSSSPSGSPDAGVEPCTISTPCPRACGMLARRLMLEGLATAHAAGRLAFFGDLARLKDGGAFGACLAPLRRKTWFVYAKPPFAGPKAVLAYLSHYTHRAAIANSRLIAATDAGVTFADL